MKYFYTKQRAHYRVGTTVSAPPDIYDSSLIGLEVTNIKYDPLAGYTFNLQGYKELFFAPSQNSIAVDTPENRKLFEAIRRDRLDLVAKERELDWYREEIGKRATELVYIGEQHV